MAEKAKKKRSSALASFTRNYNSLLSLINVSSPISVITPQYERVMTSWAKLEAVHEEFIDVTDIDIETDDNGLKYLDEPNERKQEGLSRYATYLKQIENEKKADSSSKETKDAEERRMADIKEKMSKNESVKAEFFSEVDCFRVLSSGFRDLLTDITADDMRAQWSKIEDEFKQLREMKRQIISLEPDGDLSRVNEGFSGLEENYLLSQRSVLIQLKHISSTSAAGDLINPKKML